MGATMGVRFFDAEGEGGDEMTPINGTATPGSG